jgi:Predicted glycosyltransferases
LESVLEQTYKHLEIIICDNGTNDQTEHLMHKYDKDCRIIYVRNKEAQSKQANFAPFEALAHGEFLQWLMDDDVLDEDKIEKMVDVFLSNKGITLVSSNRRWIDETGKDLNVPKEIELDAKTRYTILDGRILGKSMLLELRNFIGEPSSALFRQSDLINQYWQAECRGYKTISDVVMWLELLEKGNCAFFQEPLSSYRRHTGQEGQNLEVIILSRFEWLKLIDESYGKQYFLLTEEEYKLSLQKFLIDAKEVVLPVLRKGQINTLLANCYKEKVAIVEQKYFCMTGTVKNEV